MTESDKGWAKDFGNWKAKSMKPDNASLSASQRKGSCWQQKESWKQVPKTWRTKWKREETDWERKPHLDKTSSQPFSVSCCLFPSTQVVECWPAVGGTAVSQEALITGNSAQVEPGKAEPHKKPLIICIMRQKQSHCGPSLSHRKTSVGLNAQKMSWDPKHACW